MFFTLRCYTCQKDNKLINKFIIHDIKDRSQTKTYPRQRLIPDKDLSQTKTYPRQQISLL